MPKENKRKNQRLISMLAELEIKVADKSKNESSPVPWMDKTKTTNQRKESWNEYWEQMMNPVEESDFNPDTFEPLDDAEEFESGVATRHLERVEPQLPLYTHGIRPKQLRKGQMIGFYESKQDIYLTLAWTINKLWAELEVVKREIEELKNG